MYTYTLKARPQKAEHFATIHESGSDMAVIEVKEIHVPIQENVTLSGGREGRNRKQNSKYRTRSTEMYQYVNTIIKLMHN